MSRKGKAGSFVTETHGLCQAFVVLGVVAFCVSWSTVLGFQTTAVNLRQSFPASSLILAWNCSNQLEISCSDCWLPYEDSIAIIAVDTKNT